MLKILKDYKHIICLAVTLVFVGLGVFVFNGALWRLIETVCDLGTSIAFSFLDLFDLSDKIPLTFLQLPKSAPWSNVLTTNAPDLFCLPSGKSSDKR